MDGSLNRQLIASLRVYALTARSTRTRSEALRLARALENHAVREEPETAMAGNPPMLKPVSLADRWFP
jgi:hypothetical protein